MKNDFPLQIKVMILDSQQCATDTEITIINNQD